MDKRPIRMSRLGPGAAAALIACLAVAPVAALAGPSAVATAVSLEVDGETTRFELALDRDLEFSVFALADPYRVIIDMPETEFRIADDAGATGGGLVTAFRFGLFSSGRSRVVLDASGPVAIARPVIHKQRDGRPARLVVELTATTREIFMRDFALNGESRGAAVAPPTMRAAILPEVAGVENEIPVIVIDPGHGGVDPGAIGRSGVREKDVVLGFAAHLAAKLRASGGFEVVMTRDSDVFLRLDERRQVARDNNADLFVSIHADSIRYSGIHGASVYTASDKASDEDAAALAASENRADLIAGVALEEIPNEVGDILIDLMSRDTKIRSIDFARALVQAMRGGVRLNGNPHRYAGFVVLKNAGTPSVLLELGYLSNSQDESEMRSEEWRDRVSSLMEDAVRDFFSARLAETQ